jgi:EPS-associated MarR family transcriptional regulator
MVDYQAKIQEDTHFRNMRILQNNPYLTQPELAGKLGMSVGGPNYSFNALIDKGCVKTGNFLKRKNSFKFKNGYLPTPLGIAEKVRLTSRFLKRKMEEYDALNVETEALKAEAGEEEVDGLRRATK